LVTLIAQDSKSAFRALKLVFSEVSERRWHA
jgi:hypothetical protein